MRVKRILMLVKIAILLFSTTSCSTEALLGSRNEIENITFINTVGVDKSPSGDIRITVAKKFSKMGGAGGGAEYKAIPYSVEGKTISEAVDKLFKVSDKLMFWGQNEYILISEDVAKENIMTVLDFFIRKPDCRLNSNVLVVRGGLAEDIINKANTSTYFVHNRLDNLHKGIHNISETKEVTLLKFIYALDNKYICPYLPYIKLVDVSQDEGEDADKMDIELSGFAIFKGSRLFGYLDNDTAKGFNLVTNNMIQGTIVVPGPSGGYIALEISSAKTKVKPIFKEGELSISLEVEFVSNIKEVTMAETIFNDKSVDFIKNEQDKVIRMEMLNAIKYAQDNKLDIFSIGDIVYHKHPVKWERIKDKWNTLFPKLNFEVSIESSISRSYIMRNPISTKGEDKQ